MTAIHLYMSEIHTTVINVPTAKDTASVIKTLIVLEVTIIILVGFIDNFLLVALIDVGCCSNVCPTTLVSSMISVPNITVVHRDVGGSPNGTTLTATVGVTLHCRDAVVEEVISSFSFRNGRRQVVLEYTDDNMCLTGNIE